MDPSDWSKIKTSLQGELLRILDELERLGRDRSATAIRRVAASPEDEFGTASEWLFGIIEVVDDVLFTDDISGELRMRLQHAKSGARDALYSK
jgi:hypothetical protein